MLGERDEPVLEQGQPMLHAGEAAAVADRLVERIAGRGGAEHLAVAAAEALDALLVEQRLGGRQQHEMVDRAGGALGRRHRSGAASRSRRRRNRGGAAVVPDGEEIDDAAAHGILAGVVHGVGADIAVRLEQRGRAGRWRSARPGARRATIWRMRKGVSVFWVTALIVVRTSCGPLGLPCSVEAGEALEAARSEGDGAVIGQAIPGGDVGRPPAPARNNGRCCSMASTICAVGAR